jgi:hypothetical protein
MLGSLLGRLYRRAVGRILGLDALVEERMPEVVRDQLEITLRNFVRGKVGRDFPLDVALAARFLAAGSSAEYFAKHMRMAQNLGGSHALIEFALAQCRIDGLVLEFGVYEGKSLRLIAGLAAQTVYGFDSFEGLPEDWTHMQRKGRFSLDGVAPRFDEPNVELVPGWFDRTLPPFLAAHAGPVRFLHADADLYSSTETILGALRGRIVPGTVIVLNEYFNYPGWEHHEYRAFQEFIRDTGLRYEYLGFASAECAVAVRIL